MDRREAILYETFHAESEDCRTRREDLKIAVALNPDIDRIYLAMDEHAKEMCLLFLEFVAHETTGHSMNETKGELEFKYKGQWISKEALFENFL